MMAAHITCHRNDIVPNRYPPPRPTPRDHGSTSQYAPIHVMPTSNKSAIYSGVFESLQEEDFPIFQKPAPVHCHSSDYTILQDPLLCLTPDQKQTKSKLTCFNQNNSARNLENQEEVSDVEVEDMNLKKSSGTQRVRFDSTVNVRQLSPEISVDGSLFDSQMTNVRTAYPDMSFEDIIGPSHEEEDSFEAQEPLVKKYSYNISGLEYDNNIDEIALKTVESLPRKQTHSLAESLQEEKVALPRKVANHKKERTGVKDNEWEAGEDYPGLPSVIGTSEHYLARPELHSTLRVSKEINQLKQSELDVAAAVERQLKISSKTKAQIEEKAYGKVNVGRRQYADLAGVDVSHENLFYAPKVKPTHKTRQQKPEDRMDRPPDMMEYFTDDLQKETASWTLAGQAETHNGLQTADLHRAFDVYQHIRVWEGW